MLHRRHLMSLIAGGAGIVATAAGARVARSRRFIVTAHGARGDGKTLNTAAIQSAIDACAAAGGGTVVVPAGDFMSGSLFLKAGANLELQRGAILRGSPNQEDFPLAIRRFARRGGDAMRMALINADGIRDLRITGPGTLDGNGGTPGRNGMSLWYMATNGKSPKLSVDGMAVEYGNPQIAFIKDCPGLVVSGVRFKDAAFWNLHLYRCNDAIVEDCRFEVPHTTKAPSSDGIDIDSCNGVTVRRCFFSVDDDSVVLKGSWMQDARFDTESPPVENIRVYDCEFHEGLGALVLGSNAVQVRNVRMWNCTVRGKQPMLRFKIRPDTPGQVYENIDVRNVVLDSEGMIVNARLKHGTKAEAQMPGGIIRAVTISGVRGRCLGFGDISADPTTKVSDFTFTDFHVTTSDARKSAPQANGATDIRFRNVVVNGRQVIGPTSNGDYSTW